MKHIEEIEKRYSSEVSKIDDGTFPLEDEILSSVSKYNLKETEFDDLNKKRTILHLTEKKECTENSNKTKESVFDEYR